MAETHHSHPAHKSRHVKAEYLCHAGDGRWPAGASSRPVTGTDSSCRTELPKTASKLTGRSTRESLSRCAYLTVISGMAAFGALCSPVAVQTGSPVSPRWATALPATEIRGAWPVRRLTLSGMTLREKRRGKVCRSCLHSSNSFKSRACGTYSLCSARTFFGSTGFTG